MSTDIPFWSIFSKFTIRRTGGGPGRLRIILEIPTGAAERAERLLHHMKLGRVEEGTYLVEGRDLPAAMRRLGFPPDAVDHAARFIELRGRRGAPTPESVLREREASVAELKVALQTAIKLNR